MEAPGLEWTRRESVVSQSVSQSRAEVGIYVLLAELGLAAVGWGWGWGCIFEGCCVPCIFVPEDYPFFAWWLPNCLAVGAGDSGVGVGVRVGDFFVCMGVLFTPPLLPLPLFAVGGSYRRRPPFLCGDGSREGVHFVVCQRTYET